MEQKRESLMDIELGLQYSGGQEDLYKELLKVFCNMKNDKWPEMEQAFADGKWEDYVTLAHTMKSTSLTVGGKHLSEAAKALELAGKAYLAPDSSEGTRQEKMKFIQDHHASTMRLCDEFIAEAENWLRDSN